ncbi:MAG: hypothetical protein ACLP05_00070 [Candidatus Kryptoniota bacterium]
MFDWVGGSGLFVVGGSREGMTLDVFAEFCSRAGSFRVRTEEAMTYRAISAFPSWLLRTVSHSENQAA